MRTTPPRWDAQPQLLIDLAVADLDAGDDVRPTMVAFDGDAALLLATLRPFDKGAHQDAIVEVGALAVGLGADRLALSLAGRAWSRADPIAPVIDDGCDLRQRVICVHTADAAAPGEPRGATTIVPYDVDATGTVVTGDPITDSRGEGWVPGALLVMASAGRGSASSDDDPAASAADDDTAAFEAEDDAALVHQVVRCVQLGHRLAWSPQLADRLDPLRLHLPSGASAYGRGPRVTGSAPRPGW